METKDIFKTPSEITVLPHKVGISSDFNSIENDPDCDKNSLEKVDKHKIITLFVRDILKSEKQNDYFVIGNHKFKFVQIFGTVVSKSVTKKMMFVEVHDGSSSITCFLEDDCFCQHQDENYERFQGQEKSSDNIFHAATVILFSSLRYLSSRFFLKHPNSVMRGDIVS
nr:uncharacterized protein LOC111517606 [Leptinotarsa decemlineata]